MTRVLRSRAWSVRVDVRALVLVGALLLITFGIAGVSLVTGDFPVPVGAVLRSLTGRGETGTDFIVLTLRLPRIMAALLVGAVPFGLWGAFRFLRYILVLFAMRIAPVSHVAPAREISMMLGAWMGGRFLNEGDVGRRVVGSGLIATGVAALALG